MRTDLSYHKSKNSIEKLVYWFTMFMFSFVIPLPAGILLMLYIVRYERCESIQELSGNKTDFSITSGCFVEHKGRMIPVRNWKVRKK